MELVRSLSRRLTYANVVASLALFAALGGGAYAANKINGNSIQKQSIGGGKLKNETITSRQIKKGSLNSNLIDMSTFTTVPSATTATTAQTATTATTAQSATTAQTATSATHATSAETAERATSATTAESATTAQTATTATTASTATTATSAANADTVGGKSASELTDSCQSGTSPYGGMCWDETQRSVKTWVGATIECGDAGGRLPSLGELIAFVSQTGVQATGSNWSDDVEGFEGGEPKILTRDETAFGSSKGASSLLGFRCVFYRTND
jgi:cytoskeletal protein RodZ